MSEPAGRIEAKMPASTPSKPWNVPFQTDSYLPAEVMNIGEMQIHDRARGRFIFRCSCVDCKFFFRRGDGMRGDGMRGDGMRGDGMRGDGMRCVNLHPIEVLPRTPPPPPHSYMVLVNNIRAAAADREEKRDERRRAQREMAMAAAAAATAAAAAAAGFSPKKGKPVKDQSKKNNLHQIMKRRRQ